MRKTAMWLVLAAGTVLSSSAPLAHTSDLKCGYVLVANQQSGSASLINGAGSVGLAVGGTDVGGKGVGATVGAWVSAVVAAGGIGVDAIAVGWTGGGAHA